MVRGHATDLFGEDFLRRIEALGLLAKRAGGSVGASMHPARSLGDGLDFADHRAYSPGDDPRFLDWPYYARMGRLLVRRFHQHSDAEVAILLDRSGSMAPPGQPGAFDHARRLAAALAYVAMASGSRVRIVPFSDSAHPALVTGRDRAKILAVLEYLQALEPAGQVDWKHMSRSLDSAIEPGSLVLLLSDLLCEPAAFQDSLRRLRGERGQRERVVLHTWAREDARAELDGPLRLHDAETGEEILLDATPALREACRHAWDNARSALKRACRREGVVYVTAGSDETLEAIVLRSLRIAGVVG